MDGYELIEKQLEAYRQALPEGEEEWPFRIQKTYECIIANLYNPRLKVSWLKKQCFIGGHNFSARFAHFTGMKPKAFINHHRMCAAKMILSNSQFHALSIPNIAAEVGILSVSTFTRSFEHHNGVTPAKYREMH